MINTLAVHGYRSLRELRVPLGTITVVTGANGTGKSSLYRALRLLADCAEGQVVASLAREGGLPSTLWAGPEVIGKRRAQRRVRGAGHDAVRTGQPAAGLRRGGLLLSDRPRHPHPERLGVQSGPGDQAGAGLERRGAAAGVDAGAAQARRWSRSGTAGTGCGSTSSCARYESMLTEVIDPVRAPELLQVREQVRSWRFYDHFRTDHEAPARQTQIGTRTPVLHHDGRDLAAALQTIVEIGDAGALHATIADAFPRLVADRTRRRRPVRPPAQRPRAAPAAGGGRTVGRHPALPAAGRGPAQPAAARLDGAERAGDQPAPRPAGPVGPADRPGQRVHPDRGGLPLGAVDHAR